MSLLAAALLGGALAQAEMADPAVTVGPEFSMVGPLPLTGRPGLRLGFEPDRRFGVDAFYSVMFANIWHAGLAPEARYFFGKDERKGVYLGGRLPVGLLGDMQQQPPGTTSEVTTDTENTAATANLTADDPPDERRMAAAVGLQATVGWRFGRIMGIEAAAGPEWDGLFGVNWRVSLALEILMRNEPDPDAPPQRR